MSTADRFRARSIHHLREEYLPRIARALEVLPPEDLWWRPHPEANSVGNLLLHLEGNVRQWLLCGLDGQPDHRERAREFAAREGAPAPELLAALTATVEAACEVIAQIPETDLLTERTIQCFVTDGLAAIYHVVEHFSWHTGQIAWIAKERAGAGHGLAFYDESRLGARNPGPEGSTA